MPATATRLDVKAVFSCESRRLLCQPGEVSTRQRTVELFASRSIPLEGRRVLRAGLGLCMPGQKFGRPGLEPLILEARRLTVFNLILLRILLITVHVKA